MMSIELENNMGVARRLQRMACVQHTGPHLQSQIRRGHHGQEQAQRSIGHHAGAITAGNICNWQAMHYLDYMEHQAWEANPGGLQDPSY